MCKRCIFVEWYELVSPAVEYPVASDALVAIEHIDRAGITEPRIIEWKFNHFNGIATQQTRTLCVLRIGNHGYWLEARNGFCQCRMG